MPLRATLSVTFREYKTLQDQLKELNLQSADHSKRHVVVQGETLTAIAAKRIYGDPAAWRVIAKGNLDRIDNPRRLRPGLELALPPLESSATTAGRGSS